MNPSHEKILSYLEKWMIGFNWDPEHMKQTARLSARIFDELRILHGLGDNERFLLLAGALVHDIGFLEDEKRHHKCSRDHILEHRIPGMGSREHLITAMLARYHRKAEPKKKHKRFSTLSRMDQEIVRTLASILRVADGLDRSHTKVVTDLDCRLEDDRIFIRLHTYRDSSVELYGAEKKSGLMEKVFNRSVVFEVA